MSTTHVIGLDHDSKGFHAVAFGPEHRPWQTFASRDRNADVRRIDACHAFRLFLEDVPVGTHIFAEEPLALKNGRTTRLLALMAGALWAQTLSLDVFWHWVDVSHWKREVVGNGNASKEQVAEWVRVAARKMPGDRLIQYDISPDLYDAHCLAVYGRRMIPFLEQAA